MDKPNCSAARAVELDGETFYECSDPDSPCYQNLCNSDMCIPEDDSSNIDDCMFKDYYGICQNDDSCNHGDYCSGNCDSYESK